MWISGLKDHHNFCSNYNLLLDILRSNISQAINMSLCVCNVIKYNFFEKSYQVIHKLWKSIALATLYLIVLYNYHLKPSFYYRIITILLFFSNGVLRQIFYFSLQINIDTFDGLDCYILFIGHWDSWWLCLWCWDHRQVQQQRNLSQTTETTIIGLFPVLYGEFIVVIEWKWVSCLFFHL